MTEVGATVLGNVVPVGGGEGAIVEKMDDGLKGSSTGASRGFGYVKPSIVLTHERMASDHSREGCKLSGGEGERKRGVRGSDLTEAKSSGTPVDREGGGEGALPEMVETSDGRRS